MALGLVACGYFLSKPMLYVENIPARDMPCKVYPLRDDSVVLLIPYRLTVQNNRWKEMDFRFVSDENADKIHPDNLLYNVRGIELKNYYDPNYKNLSDDYFAQKYRNTVFPFWSRTFYYFRPYRLAQKELDLSLDTYTDEQIKLQLTDLHENFQLTWPAPLLDSLYGLDRGHSFNLYFGYGALAPHVQAKTATSEQKVINLRDSVRYMDTEKAKAWLLEYYNRPVSENKSSDSFQ